VPPAEALRCRNSSSGRYWSGAMSSDGRERMALPTLEIAHAGMQHSEDSERRPSVEPDRQRSNSWSWITALRRSARHGSTHGKTHRGIRTFRTKPTLPRFVEGWVRAHPSDRGQCTDVSYHTPTVVVKGIHSQDGYFHGPCNRRDRMRPAMNADPFNDDPGDGGHSTHRAEGISLP